MPLQTLRAVGDGRVGQVDRLIETSQNINKFERLRAESGLDSIETMRQKVDAV